MRAALKLECIGDDLVALNRAWRGTLMDMKPRQPWCANPDRADKGDRIAATIRHNRARGKHAVNAMSEIVVDLARRNWNEEKIARELGMDADEVLRLKQVSGLAEMFADREFSEAWEVSR